MAGKDLIVDTEAVGRYLAQDGNEKPASEEWKHRAWKGDGLDLLWFDKLDHAQVFDTRRNCEILANVVVEYSLKELLPKSNGHAAGGSIRAN